MFHHITVLKQEAVHGLNIKPNGIYVDCTLGGAGHTQLIASKLNETGKLIAIDQDEVALQNARKSSKDLVTALYSSKITSEIFAPS